MSDIFNDLNIFFESSKRFFNKSRLRVVTKKSEGFEKNSLNLSENKFSTDYLIERSTRERKGFNKKIRKFDSSDNFNSSFLFDE
jgi:hypothetical protein